MKVPLIVAVLIFVASCGGKPTSYTSDRTAWPTLVAMRFDSGFGQADYVLALQEDGCAYFHGHSPMLRGEYVGSGPYDGALWANIVASETPPPNHRIDAGYLHIRIQRKNSETDLYGMSTDDRRVERLIEGAAFNTRWITIGANTRARRSWEAGVLNACKWLVGYGRVSLAEMH